MTPRPLITLAIFLTLATVLASNAWAVDTNLAAALQAQSSSERDKASAPALLPTPPLFAAEYTVKADGFKVGEMNRSVEALGNDTYLVQTRVKTTGLAALFKPDEYVERSVLRVTPDAYVPLEFTSRYTGRSKDVVENLRFDWNQKLVRSLRDGVLTDVAIEPGVLDKLMYQVQMQYELARGVTQFRYSVADRGKIELYEMEVVGEEVLNTALGKQRTVKVKKGTTMIWCAIDLDYLPMKVEQNDDGHIIGSYIVSLKRNPPPTATTAVAATPLS